MILLRMRGGRLGNQFFQYAFARYLQIMNPNQELRINFDDVKSKNDDIGFENSLKHFNIPSAESDFSISEVKTKFQKIITKIYWRFYPNISYEQMRKKKEYQMKWIKILSLFGIYHFDYGYYKFPVKKKWFQKNFYIYGAFESELYFSEIRNILLEEYTPKYPTLETNAILYQHINNENSVAVSIRRGDFIKDDEVGKVHNVCSKEYFEKAITYAQKLIHNPSFVFFSDDIEWVKKNLIIDAPCYYESGNDPIWEKMRLMYSCKHFIISNSTFSWWGQYLGRYSQKIVIAPSRWLNSDIIPDIYQPHWHLIDV